MKYILILLLLGLSSCSVQTEVGVKASLKVKSVSTKKHEGNISIKSFAAAKRHLRNIYEKTSLKKETIYCGCIFNGPTVDPYSCGLKNKVKRGKEQYVSRSKRVEWEHVVPASKSIGAFSECRKPSGKPMSRKDCEKTSSRYRLLISDVHNLQPSVGSLNAHRSNYQFAEISGEKREWGKCDFEISSRKVEPRDSVKGDIARTYMYMNSAYPFVGFISNKNKRLFSTWDKLDPVSTEECKRHELLKQVQGNTNPYIENKCK